MVNQYKEKIRRFDCAVKIVILDDELEFSKILDKKIKEYCARKDLLYDCQIFSSGKTLLEDDLSSIQVAFLDIDMPEFNGLDVAKVLHQRYPEMILIFVTFFIKYAPSGYKVNAFRYTIIQSIGIAIGFYSFISVWDVLVLLAISFLSKREFSTYMENPVEYYLICYGVKCVELLIVAIVGLLAKKRFQFKNTIWQDWLRVMLFPLTTTFCSVMFFQIYEIESNAGTELLLCEIVLLFFDVMAIWLLDYMDQQQAALQDNIILKRSIKQEKESMEALVDAYSDQRRKTHDFQNACAVNAASLPKSPTSKLLIQQQVAQLKAVSQSVAAFQQEMLRLSQQLPEFDTVMEMYGVGPSLGPQLMAEIGDVRRFSSKKSLIAFAGIEPQPNDSGKIVGNDSGISKVGSAVLRRTLFLIMTVILKTQPQDEPVFQFMNKKRSEGKPYKVYMMASANKFLRIYYARVKAVMDSKHSK